MLPARWVGKRLAAISRESMQLNAAMSQTMTERFNVAGALLVKIFGRPEEESAQFSAKAARVRDIGITSAMWPVSCTLLLSTMAVRLPRPNLGAAMAASQIWPSCSSPSPSST